MVHAQNPAPRPDRQAAPETAPVTNPQSSPQDVAPGNGASSALHYTGRTAGYATDSDAVLAALVVLGAHARRVRSSGVLHVIASVRTNRPAQLRHTREHGIDRRLAPRTLDEFDRMAHEVDLTEIFTPGRGLVAAGHSVTPDIVAGFGLAESLQTSLEGDLRWPYINPSYRPYVERWVEQFDIPVAGRT